MKLMTINTHSLIEAEYEKKLLKFVDMVAEEKPDILALQEVNQLAEGAVLQDEELLGYIRCPGFSRPVRLGNHAARTAKLLRQRGLEYHWTWVSAKLGYDKYDEGLALMSLRPIVKAEQFLISRSEDYHDWKTRGVVGIQVEGLEQSWFYTVHMGWWDDAEEPFARQWETLNRELEARNRLNGEVWLMGDFNSPETTHGQGYTCIRQSGWLDSYHVAIKKDSGVTVEKVIDGWHERTGDLETSQEMASGMRLDYMFSNRFIPVSSSRVVCNGRRYPVVSDHYGVMIEIGEGERSVS